MSIEKKYLYFSTDIKLELNEILDKLNSIDYDYLVEELIARRILEPNEKYLQRVQHTTPRELDFVKAMTRLKDKYYLLDEEFINRVIELARKL